MNKVKQGLLQFFNPWQKHSYLLIVWCSRRIRKISIKQSYCKSYFVIFDIVYWLSKYHFTQILIHMGKNIFFTELSRFPLSWWNCGYTTEMTELWFTVHNLGKTRKLLYFTMDWILEFMENHESFIRSKGMDYTI